MLNKWIIWTSLDFNLSHSKWAFNLNDEEYQCTTDTINFNDDYDLAANASQLAVQGLI